MKKRNFLISSIFLLGFILIPLNLNAQENTNVIKESEIQKNRAAGIFDLPDDNLQKAMVDFLNKETGSTWDVDNVPEAELSGLYYVSAYNVATLDGLDYYISKGYLDNLTEFEIVGGSISDISPLAGWTTLTYLAIVDSNISDISILPTMTGLNEVAFINNQISDISPLESIPNLYKINFDNNNISDISPLTSNDKLFTVVLSNNNISDISPLSNNVNIHNLNINGNRVSDISAVANMTQMEEFHGNDNLIEDVSALANKPSMGLVEIDNNKVYDLSPLSTVRDITADNQNVEIDLGDYEDIEDIKLLPNEVSIFLRDGTEIKIPYGFDINDVVDYDDYSYTVSFNQDVGFEKFNGTITVTFSYLAPIPLTPLDPSIPITIPPVKPVKPVDPTDPSNPSIPSDPSTPDNIDTVGNKNGKETKGKKLIQTGKENFFIIFLITVLISSSLVLKIKFIKKK